MNEVGCYRKMIEIPEDWLDGRVFLYFGGVKAAFRLWVNGEEIGYSQDSMLPAEFELTGKLKAGENLAAVQVYRFCDGSYLEDQDMWYLNGIFRDVFLYKTPKTLIEDFYYRAELDAQYRNAVFTANVWLATSEAEDEVIAAIEMKAPDGGMVF